jgi:hypothetical protein
MRRRTTIPSLLVGAMLGAASVRAEQPAPAIAFLNFSDGSEGISLGDSDDAPRNVSTLCETPRVGSYWGSSDCGDRASCMEFVADLVERHWEDMNIVFTLERPKSGPYTMVMIGPPSGTCGFGVEGAAPLDCDNGNPSNVVFAFDCAASAAACSVTISQELAHSFGLAHTYQTCDIMTPGSFRCSEPVFSKSDAPADDTTCGAVQNNHGRLLDVLGPWTGGDSHRLPSGSNPSDVAAGCSMQGRPSRSAPALLLVLLALLSRFRERARAPW